jgi:hypothetical protein
LGVQGAIFQKSPLAAGGKVEVSMPRFKLMIILILIASIFVLSVIKIVKIIIKLPSRWMRKPLKA